MSFPVRVLPSEQTRRGKDRNPVAREGDLRFAVYCPDCRPGTLTRLARCGSDPDAQAVTSWHREDNPGHDPGVLTT